MKGLTRRDSKSLTLLCLGLIGVLALSLLTCRTFAPAEGDSVGVKVGDWVKYSVKRIGWFAGEPPFSMERAEWIRIEVQEISGSTVTMLETIFLTDGSQVNITNIQDLQKTWRAGYFFLSANLSAGDEIRVAEWVSVNTTHSILVEELQINSTVSKNYYGTIREVNSLHWSYFRAFFGRLLNFTEEYTWDRETGFLAESTFQMCDPDSVNASVPTFKLEIADTNLWKMAPESQSVWSQWAPWVALGVLATGGAATGIFMYHHRKNEGHEK